MVNGLDAAATAELIASLAPEDRELWDAMGEATPRFTSWPIAGARHDLAANDLVAEALGTPLMPWQRWWVRVSSERLASDSRRYRFPDEVVTVPRQAGKTTGIRTQLATRALRSRGRRAFYTAQTGKDARQRWGDLVEAIESGPFRRRVHKRVQAGSESLTFHDTRSTISPFAPTPTSLHGYTPHDVVLDEIFAFSMAEGIDLVGAVKPAQSTLPDRKLVKISTAGNLASEWLRSEVDRGRAAVLDPESRVLYLEWSMEETADAYDESAWTFHPALGHTQTIEDLREAAETMPASEWNRAYCNRWDNSDVAVLDLAAWDDATQPLERLKLSRCAVAFQMAPDRSRFAAVAAWRTSTGKVAVKTIHSHSNPHKAPHQIAELYSRHPLVLAADDAGASRVVTDEARRVIAKMPRDTWDNDYITTLAPRDYVTASMAFKARLDDGTLVHELDDDLREAVKTASTKKLRESWAFSHNSRPELIAAAVAVHALDARPESLPLPDFFIAS